MTQLKLLVVDDIPIIADGLYELFREIPPRPLEVHKAYSAPEAFELMERTPIDIVVTDIKMPEITGLDMLREINRRWPRCKVIFLTSYHDFEYAREAVKLGGFDFILKTEDDDRILQAVDNAASELLSERESSELLAKAQEQYRLALPSLRKSFLRELLQGQHGDDTREEQFAALTIPLHPARPVYLVLARIDGWKRSTTWSDQAMLHYSVANIMEECLSPHIRLVTLSLESSHLVCLWQPPEDNDGGAAGSAKAGGDPFRFVYDTFETIQNICRELLQLQISFILNAAHASWSRIGSRLQQLELMLQRGIGLNRELLTTDAELESNHAAMHGMADGTDREPRLVPPESEVYLQMSRYALLQTLLASGKREEFFELYEELAGTVRAAGAAGGIKLEAVHFLAHLFIGHINRQQLFAPVTERYGLESLTRIDPNPDWEVCIENGRELAGFLFEHTTADQETRSNRLIAELQAYIRGHLSEDLSLTSLGERVHLNSTYLSRLYKQITGEGISDYIMEMRLSLAKTLLESSDKKIYEIAEEIGYQSGIAFTRFFKKMTNVTPQDYREMKQAR